MKGRLTASVMIMREPSWGGGRKGSYGLGGAQRRHRGGQNTEARTLGVKRGAELRDTQVSRARGRSGAQKKTSLRRGGRGLFE